MRKYLVALISSALFLACSENSQTELIQGGISVGNGLKTYRSEHGYQLKYPSGLSLREDGDRKVQITSAPLEEKESKLNITVLQSSRDVNKPIQDEETLEHLAESLGANKWEALELGNGMGLKFSEKKDSVETQTSLILSNNGVLIQAVAELPVESQAASHIAPIVESIEFDLLPPEISKIEILNKQVKASKDVRIRIVANDNLSDLSHYPTIILQHSEDEKEWIIGIGEPMTRVGHNVYEVSVNVPEWQRSGRYFISEIRLSDTAQNLRIYSGGKNGIFNTVDMSLTVKEGEDGFKLVDVKRSKVNLGEHFVEVENKEAQDIAYPEILSVGLERAVVQAGEDLVVRIEAKDDLSGIVTDWIQVSMRGEGGHYLEDYPVASVKKAGENTYHAVFRIGSGFRPGRYQIDNVWIVDAAGKAVETSFYKSDDDDGEQESRVARTFYQTRWTGMRYFSSEEIGYESRVVDEIPNLVFEVKNEGAVNQHLPVIESATVTTPLKPGDTGYFEFQVDKNTELFERSLMLFAQPEGEAVLDDGNIFSYISPRGRLVQLDEQRFRYEFEVPQNMPSGVYFIEWIHLWDASGNARVYLADRKGRMSFFYSWLYTSIVIYGGHEAEFFVPDESDKFYMTENRGGEDEWSELPVIRFEVVK